MSRKERIKSGAFFTVRNPFREGPFAEWFAQCDPKHIVEPCAGDGVLRKFVQEIKSGLNWKLYDIAPKAQGIRKRNTLTNFPRGFDCCITNPPYLSERRARSLGVMATNSKNLWQVFLDLALSHCHFVAIILPQTFISKAAQYPRLRHIVLLPPNSCNGTEQAVCLALFDRDQVSSATIWRGDEELGELTTLRSHALLKIRPLDALIINHPLGQLGLNAADSRCGDLIKFVPGRTISSSKVRGSSRHVTRILINFDQNETIDTNVLVEECNAIINELRRDTSDLALTAISGSNANGLQRRRLTYRLALKIVSLALNRIRSQRVSFFNEK